LSMARLAEGVNYTHPSGKMRRLRQITWVCSEEFETVARQVTRSRRMAILGAWPVIGFSR
jgi:hypothetical protein